MPEAPARTPKTVADSQLSPEDEAALAEEVELDVDLRRRILVLHRDLERLDHYALLGLDSSADRKALKRAYFDLAAKFHPDKYFRKKLGSYKLRMEAIFGRITLAHDTLTNKQKREEYDAYLGEQRRSRGIEELLADALAEVRRAEENVEREARADGAPAPAPPSPDPVPTSTGAPPPPAPPAYSPTVDVAARRDALARRLLGGRPPPGTAAATVARPASPGTPSAADAMAALRRRYEERRAMATAAQTRKYVANGEAALASGDAVAAANAFRVAQSLSPDDASLAQRAGEAQARADEVLAETYSRQATYEEKNGQWADAARSWARVCKARPNDATAQERTAHAMAKSNGDLHDASRYALRACTLEPQNAAFRVTLANVYLAAGLALNARRELETAAQLAPHDGTIQAMLKRVGRSA